MAAMGLFALYLAIGFLALPVIVKGQIEKQAAEKLGQRISVGEVRFNPLMFRFEVGEFILSDPESGPLVSFKRLLVDFELRSAIDRAWTFAHLTLEAPVLRFDIDKDGRHNFTALLKRLRDNGSENKSGVLPRFIFRRVMLNNARIEFRDRQLEEPLVARIEPLQIEIDNLSSLTAQAAKYRLSGRTIAGETFESSGELALNPVSSKGRLKLNDVKMTTLARGLSRLVALEQPAGKLDFSASFDFALDNKDAISMRAQDLDLDVTALSLGMAGSGAPLMAIGTLELKQGRVDLNKREATFGKFGMAQGSIEITVDKDGTANWSTLMSYPAASAQDRPRTSSTAEGGQSETAAKPWRVSVAGAEVADFAVKYTDAARDKSFIVESLGFGMSPSAEFGGAAGAHIEISNPKIALTGISIGNSVEGTQLRDVSRGAVQVSSVNIGATSMTIVSPDGVLDVTADGLGAALTDAVVRNPGDATELARLGNATLSGGVLRLKERLISADRLVLSNGKVQTGFDAKGRFKWQSLLQGSTVSDAAATKSRQPAPWRLALKSTELDDFSLGFEDKRETPAMAVNLEAMRARITNLDTGSKAPLQIGLRTKLASGGEVRADGTVRPDNGMSDMKLKIDGIALAPAQPYLSKFAELRLASGTLSGEGRLRYGAETGSRLTYEGSIAINQVQLEENNPKRPFLTWDSVNSGDVVLTLEPNRLDIGELRIVRPTGRLIIAQDQTVNLMDVLKERKQRESASGAGDNGSKKAVAVSVEQSGTGDDPFPVTISRLSVSGGVLDFADLSLRPQFGTRMHELKGVITGLGSDVKRSANLQLEAQVDKYGSAKIGGQISVRQPEKFTDIVMDFRNLEMTSLSPYIEKFAGYRIASGRLALNLHYKVRERKLLGENKLVLHQVELGEKVDSPGALDLPLEFAIAILKDSDGVIDIGLPVSGDLGDPQFDYGEIIGKAFVNLLGSIVTAPFKALGALFGGGGSDKPGTIDFEPGSAALAPPERQKLEAIKRMLNQRPALMLVVPPTYSADEDTRAMKSLAVRSEILKRSGVALSPGEDPGPIDTANPRVQRAVEAAFGRRFAPEVFDVLKRRTRYAETAVGEPAEAAAQQPSSPANPPSQFYDDLVERMVLEEPVSEQALTQLATRRSEAIIRELTTAGSVPAARIKLGEPKKAADASVKAVTLQMDLEVAK